jgi:hypothetical protein
MSNNAQAGHAVTSGVAGVIHKHRAQEENNLQAGHATIRATISITRKATGKVETYEIIGTEVPQQQSKED